LLTNADKWTKFGLAHSGDGELCGVWSPAAVRWDLEAAISRYTGLPVAQAAARIRATSVFAIWSEDNARSGYPCPRTLGDFNDTTTFDWLKRALSEANL